MGTRRANSEGNVYQRADGRWEARLGYVDNLTGKRRRVSVYGASQKAARAELKKVRALYLALCRKHLEPEPFGAIALDRLRPTDVEALIDEPGVL